MRGAPGNPIRVLKVVPTLLCGGTENQFMTLTRSLDASRFAISFACLRQIGPFVNELHAREIPMQAYPISSFCSLGAVRQQLRFARQVLSSRIDIVHAYNFYGNVFATVPARLGGAPVVIASVRDRGPYLTPLQRRAQRQVCRYADRVLVNADAVKEWLIGEGVEPARIVVIRNGVDLSRFDDAVDRAAVRVSLGVPPDAPLVGVISRLSRKRGLEQFLAAAARVRRSFPRARFVIVGEPALHDRAYLDELRRAGVNHGLEDHVIFTGLRQDVPRLLAALNVSVMPSLDEALSNVLLESMAAGVATVATQVGGTPEAMYDEVTGLLVPPGDVAALATAIARVLSDAPLAARLGAAARAHVRTAFSVDRMVDATQTLYLDLLARRTARRAALLPGIDACSTSR
jgi:glycosyltransferase involved in cell wall biosynthesis